MEKGTKAKVTKRMKNGPTKKHLEKVLEAIVKGNTEEAAIHLHEYLTLKTRQILLGEEEKEDKDEDKEDKDEDKDDDKEESDEDHDDDADDSDDEDKEDEDDKEDEKEEVEEGFKFHKVPVHKVGKVNPKFAKVGKKKVSKK